MSGAVWAVGWFAFRSNLRARTTRAGLIAGVLVLLLGPAIGISTRGEWSVDTGLAFYGCLVALLFGLRSGLEAHREGDFDLFLTHNLIGHTQHAAAMVVGLLLTWGTLLAATYIALLLVSMDPGLAAWYTAAWGARSAVLLGFVPLVEKVSTLRLPLVLPAFGYVFFMILSTLVVGEERALELFVVTSRADPTTLLPLVRQAAVALVASCLIFLGSAWIQQRGFLARTQIVPSRHGSAPHVD